MQKIHLDISVKNEPQHIFVKQGDVGRKFQAVITDGGSAYQIPASVQLSVWYSGTSGEGNYSAIGKNSAFVIDGNTVIVELITQMLENKGGGTLCLIINAADGSQIGTWNIPYFVEAVPGMGSPGAERYFTAFSELVNQAAESAAKAEQAAASFETDTTLCVFGKAADAKATGEALAAKAPAVYTYPSKDSGDANTIIEDFHKFVFNWSNTPFDYGFLDVMRATCEGFNPNGGKSVIVQEFTRWMSGAKARRVSTDGGASWSDWTRDELRSHPVGSIYISADSTSPALLFGGTWEQIKDVFLLAAGSAYFAGTTGGEASHTLVGSEMPAKISLGYGVAGSQGYGVISDSVAYTNGKTNGYFTVATGGGNAHNNMPPYVTVYMWKRVE